MAYWDSGCGIIAGNVMEGNVVRRIQLYLEPSGVVVTYNRIVGNGRAGGLMANGNLIVNNIVVGNADRGIRSYAVRELRNARTKLLWRNGTSGNEDDTNLGIENTIEALPRFMRDGFRQRRASKAVDPERKQGLITDLGGHKRSRDGGPRSGRLRVVVRDHSR